MKSLEKNENENKNVNKVKYVLINVSTPADNTIVSDKIGFVGLNGVVYNFQYNYDFVLPSDVYEHLKGLTYNKIERKEIIRNNQITVYQKQKPTKVYNIELKNSFDFDTDFFKKYDASNLLLSKAEAILINKEISKEYSILLNEEFNDE